MKTIIKLCVTVMFVFPLFITGCSSTGLDKRATIMPDRIGINFNQARYREEDAAYRGFGISLQWDLK